MHLPHRAAGVGQHGGEAANCSEHDAGEHARVRHQALEAFAEPVPQHEKACDKPDGEPHMGGGQGGRKQSRRRNSGSHARNHELEIPGAPRVPKGPHGERVLGEHRRQDDGGCLQRRNVKRHQRQRHETQAEETALRETLQNDREDGEQIKQRVGHHWSGRASGKERIVSVQIGSAACHHRVARMSEAAFAKASAASLAFSPSKL